jgi:hypothetical protein
VGVSEDFVRLVERDTGLTKDQILNMPIDKMRRYFEIRNGKKTNFVVGNVHGELLTTEQIDALE